MNYAINWRDIESKELVKGIHARIVHMEQMTIIRFDIEKGSVLPEHHHVHEHSLSVCIYNLFPLHVHTDVAF